MHIAARTCLNCVPRVSSFELPISVRPRSSTSGTPLGKLPVYNTDSPLDLKLCVLEPEDVHASPLPLFFLF
jgi:hypothetical protein